MAMLAAVMAWVGVKIVAVLAPEPGGGDQLTVCQTLWPPQIGVLPLESYPGFCLQVGQAVFRCRQGRV